MPLLHVLTVELHDGTQLEFGCRSYGSIGRAWRDVKRDSYDVRQGKRITLVSINGIPQRFARC